MLELIKAAIIRYIKLKIAETIYDIRKDIRKREQEDSRDEEEKPKMEGGSHTSTDFQRPDLLWQNNQIFGFTSSKKMHTHKPEEICDDLCK